MRRFYIPFILSVAFALGLYLGSGINFGNQQGFLGNGRFNKLQEIIQYIESDYVDSVSRENLIDEAIAYLLNELDPHSYYLSAEEAQWLSEPLEGNFEGIGIQFNIRKDTVYVVNTIPGGPSEKAGLLPGDRIVKVNGQAIAGTGIENADVMRLLKGEKGTAVEVGIVRSGTEKIVDFVLKRDEIPITSVEASYMMNDSTAFIRISRFARTTYDEFMQAVRNLDQKPQYIVLDLRGNGGGVMDAAVQIADEFLEKGALIVYTEGKSRPKELFYARGGGKLEDVFPLVLIDRYSASASEILAGAIQDNDRGVIIGKRSYGKGLVQEQSEWPDGSATRLTVARYFTPSGRSIQRPYEEVYGERAHSFMDEMPIEELGHDSTEQVYRTLAGRPVYGGGGIEPDVKVLLDTAGFSMYYSHLLLSGTIYDFAFTYVDGNRAALSSFTEPSDYLASYDLSTETLDSFIAFAEARGIPYDAQGMQWSEGRIRNHLKAQIGRQLYGDNVFYRLINQYDPAIATALEEIKKPGHGLNL